LAPRLQDSTLIPQHGKESRKAADVGVDDLCGKPHPVWLDRARGNRPILVEHLRNDAKFMTVAP
jgi:hypothetical protein